MKRLQFFALITLMFALAAGSHAADKIVADFGGLGAFQSTTWVAKDLQIFDKYGLNVDLIRHFGGGYSGGSPISRKGGTGSAVTNDIFTEWQLSGPYSDPLRIKQGERNGKF